MGWAAEQRLVYRNQTEAKEQSGKKRFFGIHQFPESKENVHSNDNGKPCPALQTSWSSDPAKLGFGPSGVNVPVQGSCIPSFMTTSKECSRVLCSLDQ